MIRSGFYILFLLAVSCRSSKLPDYKYDAALKYCVQQAVKTVNVNKDYKKFPRSIANADTTWRTVGHRDWTSGFWPGVLWYVYEYTKQDKWKQEADAYSRSLFPLVDTAAIDHDLG